VLEFIELPVFTKRLLALAKQHADDVLLEIQSDLLKNPTRGKVVEGTGGVRKARAADPARGKGKRGGFRYLYYFIERDGQIFLLMVFSKDEQDDLTKEQKNTLKKAISELMEEGHG
jgi:hypothetical protein